MIYNSLISKLEIKFSNIKKQNKKKFLLGLYQELFTRNKPSTHYRKIYDSMEKERQEQFIGFFMEELKNKQLDNLSIKLRKNNPQIKKIEIRAEIDNTLYRLITWKNFSQYKRLENVLENDTPSPRGTYDEFAYICELLKRNVNYVELSIDEKIYGGQTIDQLQKLNNHTLYVREDLSWLPKKYGSKFDHPSQTKILKSYGRRHNIGPMVRMYLKEGGFDMSDYSGLERLQLRREITNLIQTDDCLLKRVHSYFKGNKSIKPQLPNSLLKLEHK